MYESRRFCHYHLLLDRGRIVSGVLPAAWAAASGGVPPALSDSECLTVELVGQHLGYTSQKQLYEQMHDRWRAWFPALQDRIAFTRQYANLWQVKAWMHHHLVERLGGDQAPYQIIDTLPVPICHTARRFQRRIFRTESVGGSPHRRWAIVRPETNTTLALRAGYASPTMA